MKKSLSFIISIILTVTIFSGCGRLNKQSHQNLIALNNNNRNSNENESQSNSNFKTKSVNSQKLNSTDTSYTSDSFSFTIDKFVKEFNVNVPLEFDSMSFLLSEDTSHNSSIKSNQKLYHYFNSNISMIITTNNNNYVTSISITSPITPTIISSNDNTENFLEYYLMIMFASRLVINPVESIKAFVQKMNIEEDTTSSTISFSGRDSYASYMFTCTSSGSLAMISPV
ncbi:MAG: hypothetical protein J6I47_08675 [Ruminococcus sp.]|nr:hypothetical protein [Ruminococcus sp.]